MLSSPINIHYGPQKGSVSLLLVGKNWRSAAQFLISLRVSSKVLRRHHYKTSNPLLLILITIITILTSFTEVSPEVSAEVKLSYNESVF